MRMKLKIEDDLLITLIYLLSAVMIIGQFFGIHFITSVAYALSFVAVLGLWCMHIKKCKVLDFISAGIITLSLIVILITCESLSTSYFVNWVMFSFVFLFFSVCLKIEVRQQTVKRLFGINFVISLCCFLAYILRYNDVFYITNTGVKYLSFNFYNPNCAAIFLFCIAITGIMNFFFSVKPSIVKQACFIGLFSILISQTLSRTTLIAFIAFLVIYILFKRKERYFLPRGKFFDLIISMFPLLFSMVYIALIDSLSSDGVFAFLISEGKGLDSRQMVWEYAFDLFMESPILGSYNHLLYSSVFSQMHNSHLNVLVSYGGVVFALVIAFLYFVLKELCERSKVVRSELSVWAFIMCLLLGSGESILFSGGLSFYLFVGQFLLLSNVSTKNGGELRR